MVPSPSGTLFVYFITYPALTCGANEWRRFATSIRLSRCRLRCRLPRDSAALLEEWCRPLRGLCSLHIYLTPHLRAGLMNGVASRLRSGLSHVAPFGFARELFGAGTKRKLRGMARAASEDLTVCRSAGEQTLVVRSTKDRSRRRHCRVRPSSPRRLRPAVTPCRGRSR
jgi:hypothetical protein